MPRWIGLLGSWALLVLGLGIAGIAVAGEWINLQDSRKLRRLETVDELIAERNAEQLQRLRRSEQEGSTQVNSLQSRIDETSRQIGDLQDTDRSIVVSTAENRIYLRDRGRTVFEAVCSTGKGTTLVDNNGRRIVFDTPIGKLKILSKEENPVWVPPDWYYVEEAKKEGMRVVHLGWKDAVDADTGGPVRSPRGGGVWSWFGDDSPGSRRVLRVKGKTVVLEEGGSSRELPPGQLIKAGDAIVIPPVGVPQRQYEKELGSFRLNLGDGYAIHGTQAVGQLGQSVSHGCVRVADPDLERLYSMVEVGDEVIIY